MKKISISVVGVLLLIYLSIAVYVARHAEIDTKKQSDVIIVLGARGYIAGKYNPCLLSRVSQAVNLYKKNYAPKILMTGGVDEEDHTIEATTMKKIAQEEGVPADAILLEKRSTSTYENFRYSKDIMQQHKFHSAIIVTEPFHEPRAALIASRLQYNFTTSPAIDSPCWQPNKYFSKYFLKEPLAIGAYKLQAKL